MSLPAEVGRRRRWFKG